MQNQPQQQPPFDKVIVYGTLREHHGNWAWMLGRPPEKVVHLPKFRMYNVAGGFPGLIQSDSEDDVIIGELYNVDVTDANHMDRLEGYRRDDTERSMFNRVYVAEYEAWVYVWNRPVNEDTYVETGNWNDVVKPRRERECSLLR